MADSVVLGDVVFRKGEAEDGSDIWDDTALIEAYDNAVSVVKAKLIERGSVSEGSQGPQTPARGQKRHKRGKRKHRKDGQKQGKKPAETAHGPHWRLGDNCRAVYTEDGSLYEAVIQSIDKQTRTCVVRYLGYGNEEEQALIDLLPSEAAGATGSAAHSDVMSEANNSMETDEIEWNQPHPHATHPGHSPRGPRGHHRRPFMPEHAAAPPTDWGPYGAMPSPYGGYPGMNSMPPPPPPMPYMPGMMPPFPMPEFPIPPSAPSRSSQIPQMPEFHIPDIPPPPLMSDDEEDEILTDKEALHSMLVSWYMSGYHTGFYQGLKQDRKNTSGATTSQSDTQRQSKEAKHSSKEQTASSSKGCHQAPSPENR